MMAGARASHVIRRATAPARRGPSNIKHASCWRDRMHAHRSNGARDTGLDDGTAVHVHRHHRCKGRGGAGQREDSG